MQMVQEMIDSLLSVGRMTGEAKIMNIIRRLLLITQDIRSEDVFKIADHLDKELYFILQEIPSRYSKDALRTKTNTRKTDKSK